MGLAVERWTVQYGDEGPREVRVPHAWGQDVSVEWEGPALYKTMLEVPKRPCALRFHGVSYACRVTVAGRDVGAHEGIWDAWDVDLTPYAGTTVEVGLEVVKNGGRLFPVESVLSGFLPYVHQTWGGPFREIELVEREEALDEPEEVVGGRRGRVTELFETVIREVNQLAVGEAERAAEMGNGQRGVAVAARRAGDCENAVQWRLDDIDGDEDGDDDGDHHAEQRQFV